MRLNHNSWGWIAAVVVGIVVLAYATYLIATEPAELRWRTAGRMALLFAGLALINYCARRAGIYFHRNDS